MSNSPLGIVFEVLMSHINGEPNDGLGSAGGCKHFRCRRYGTEEDDDPEPEIDPAPGREACGKRRGHTKFDRVSLMTLVGAGQTDDGARAAYRRRYRAKRKGAKR